MPYVEVRGRTAALLAALSIALAAPLAAAAALLLRSGRVEWVEVGPGLYAPWSSALYLLLTLSAVAAALPFAVVGFVNRRYVDAIERALPVFFEGLEENLRAGMPFIRALESAARAVGGPLGREVLSVVSRVELGDSLEGALEWLGRRIPAPALRRAASLVLVAYQSGGRVAEVIGAAAEMYGMLRSYEEERRASMAPYAYTAHIALAVFLLVATIMLLVFIAPLERLAAAVGGPQLITPLPTRFYKLVFFAAAAVQAVAGGLVAGKITRGSVRAGTLQALVLLALVALYFFLLEALVEPTVLAGG